MCGGLFWKDGLGVGPKGKPKGSQPFEVFGAEGFCSCVCCQSGGWAVLGVRDALGAALGVFGRLGDLGLREPGAQPAGGAGPAVPFDGEHRTPRRQPGVARAGGQGTGRRLPQHRLERGGCFGCQLVGSLDFYLLG